MSLQATAQSEVRLAADDLMPFVFKDLVAEECMPVDRLTKKTMLSSSLDVCKKKSSILNLIQDTLEFDPQCR